jgi:hypothetical protein
MFVSFLAPDSNSARSGFCVSGRTNRQRASRHALQFFSRTAPARGNAGRGYPRDEDAADQGRRGAKGALAGGKPAHYIQGEFEPRGL